MNTPLFTRTRLSFLRNLEGMSKSDLARRIGVSPAAVTQWESGVKTPSPESIARVAQALNVPADFFTPGELAEPATPETMHYSTKSAKILSEHAQKGALAYVTAAQYVDSMLATYVDFPARNLPDIPADPEVQESAIPELAAELVRQDWAVPANEPIRHLIRSAENNGVRVIWAPERASACAPYSVDTGAFPLVVLNTWSQDYYQQRVDLATQLGHLVMHADAEPQRKPYWDQATSFAEHLLLPAEAFEREFPKRFTQDGWMRLFEMKEKWGVPVQWMLSCAHHRGILKTRRYHERLQELKAYGWKTIEPGNIGTPEDSSLYPTALRLITTEGYASTEQLSEQSRVPGWCFALITSRALRIEHISK